MKRKSMSRQASKSNFSRNAVRVHPKNNQAKPMRGGIRL